MKTHYDLSGAGCGVIELEPDEALRIVTVAQGSWRHEPRFGLVLYRQRLTKTGQRIWYSAETLTRSLALRRRTDHIFDTVPHGSLHHKPVIV